MTTTLLPKARIGVKKTTIYNENNENRSICTYC